MGMDVAIATIVSPVVLFFVLGLAAALARSPMAIPEAFSKGVAIYLMMAIGLKGGFEMAKNPLSWEVGALFLAALAVSFTIPAIAFAALRLTSSLPRIDAAAAAAHYGSISIVTFVAATQALRLAGLESSGHLVAVAAVMETPAIITGLLLSGRTAAVGGPASSADRGELMREVGLNASVVVLVGALLIGWVTGEAGQSRVEAFFITPFQGVLCLFLLDMGLAAGRGLRDGWRELDLGALSFGLYMPLIAAGLAALVSALLGLSVGDTALFMTLAASASYIAVPAAMRLALPEARPSIYLTLSLGVTFPFNVTLGIPLYIYAAQFVGA